jgi:hypothetical protein
MSLRRRVTRRNQVVRQRVRLKMMIQAILRAHLVPQCPHADIAGPKGRAWLACTGASRRRDCGYRAPLARIRSDAKKLRDLELRAGQPARRGQRGAGYGYNQRKLRRKGRQRGERASCPGLGKRAIGPIATSSPTATTISMPGIVMSRLVSAPPRASRASSRKSSVSANALVECPKGARTATYVPRRPREEFGKGAVGFDLAGS